MDIPLKEKKRAAIVAAAIYEFNKSGYSSTTMDGIACKAEVSKRTVYNHFSSKEELFQHISRKACDAVKQSTEMPFDAGISVDEQLFEIAMRQLRLVTSEDFLVMARVTLPERVRNPDLIPEGFDEIRRGETGLGRWLEEAVNADVLDLKDPKRSGRRFSAMILEFSFWPSLFGGQTPPAKKECEKIARESVDLFLNGCRGC